MKHLSQIIDKFLPEYRERYVFTAKLRCVAFIGFWVIYFYFLGNLFSQTKGVAIVVFAAFFLNVIAYLNVRRGRRLLFSFVVELISDLTIITAIIYLTEGPYSPYYTIYLFYVFVAGILYSHYLAAFVALCSAAYYAGFLLLCDIGAIPPLVLDFGDHLPEPTYTPFAHLIFAVVFLAGIVYTLKVANFFSQQRERMLEERNRQLKEANRVKSEFLATMSHELRTPLTAIIGFSELIIEGVMGEITDEQKESLKEVLHNAADLLELINSLLDLTKIESGKMRIDARTFDLKETFRRVGGTIAPLIQKKDQHLSTTIRSDMPPMHGDERKIQQLILNLLANANKFTPEGGNISVEARYYPSWEDIKSHVEWWRKIESAASSFEKGGVEIVVADDGIGIGGDHLEQVFEMFHQVDGSVTRNFGGTGVGLALARKFVEMHGGRIWVESEKGKGARFTVVLPMSVSNDLCLPSV